MRRPLALLATLAMVVPLLAASPPDGDPLDGSASSPAPQTVTGTGILPNFESEGETLIRLQVGAFDPLSDALPEPGTLDLVTDLGTLDPDAAHHWLVQVADGRYAEAIDAIEQAGGQISGSLRESTYAVRATLTQHAAIAAADSVRWTGYYQPAWKVPVAANGLPGLLEWLDDDRRDLRVNIFRTEPDPQATVAALDAIAGVDVLDATDRVVRVRASADEVAAIAALSSVEWVGVPSEPVLMNNEALWVNDTGVRDLQWAIREDRLTGAGQTAAVADTAVNYYPDLNGRAHVAFRDCPDYPDDCKLADYTQAESGNSTDEMHDIQANETDHRKMAAYFDIGGAGVNPRDNSAHGTHVAGSVTADYEPHGGWGDQGADGIAPAARLVHQNVSTPGGGLSTPGDYYELLRQAYRPRDPASVPTEWDPDDYANYRPLEDARTLNYSIGLIAPIVDVGDAIRLDDFVWEHEDMVVVSSAGNAGPSMGSIGSPSIAKSALASAASNNGRQPMSSIDSITGFSSHGPTGDGRLGPELATPGEIVIAPKGGTEDEDHYLQGTSMSGPILAGLATLVRQYFWDGYGPEGGVGFPSGAPDGLDDDAARHNPSAALVRAALVNGAERMRGPHSGDEGENPLQDGQYPSMGQGFGLANLANSLYFADDPSNNWFVDVWRDDEDAFGLGIADDRAYEIHVDEGEPLEVTLAWTDAPSLLPAGTPHQINDLDLVVTSPDGDTYVGNNFNTRANPGADEHETNSGDLPRDQVNVTEKVRIAEPEAGTWTIEVFAKTVMEGPQGYALAASGLLGEPAEDEDGEPEAFAAGPPMQTATPGAPVIDDLFVEPLSADTALVTFTTDEPTTASATIEIDGTPIEFVDVYNWGEDSPYVELYDTADPRTSDDYADRPVVSDRHEIILAGMTAGESYHVEIAAEDLDGNVTTAGAVHTATPNVFQPLAADTGQLFREDTDALPLLSGSGWQTGAQLYTGNLGATEALGAFMFRLPEHVDPATITGASVVVQGAHVFASLYDHEPHIFVDLLGEDQESQWGSQTYTEMRNAESMARAFPETTVMRGGQIGHAFDLRCTDLDALIDSLERVEDGERLAAFRIDATHVGGLPSYEFGFNHRSQGPLFRPQLVLHTDGGGDDLRSPCDPDGPAPTISDVGVNDALEDDAITVSWRTDVPSDSLVLFREQGEQEWTQVGSPVLTTSHHVQITGVDPDADYEFAVRSTACNGETTTADNGGEGWHFWWPEVPTATFWFEDVGGEPSFNDEPPSGGTQAFQEALWFSDEENDEPYHSDGAHWTGEFSGEVDGQIIFEWWWSAPPTGQAFPQNVEITVFADPVDDGSDQPDAVIGRGGAVLAVSLTPDSARSIARVDVSGQVNERLQVQVRPEFSDMVVVAHYDAESTPSNLAIPLESDIELPDDLARVGPVRPPSAEGDIDLTDVATRLVATDADREAGTARACAAPSVERLEGDTRIGTAIDVSRRSHPAGSDAVVIARDDAYPDALAGAPLARMLDAPILLTPTGQLDDDVAAEIDRLGATTAYILGGPAAISAATADAIVSETTVENFERFDGEDRFDTARLIAERIDATHAYVVEGGHADLARGWPDAMSVSGLAAHTHRPILLVLRDGIPDPTWEALEGITDVTIVGGHEAVSDAVEQAIAGSGRTSHERLAGDDRVATSHAVAREGLRWAMSPARTWFATGHNWPDALVAGPAVGYERGAFHLVDGANFDRRPQAGDWLERHRTRLGRLTLTGGTNAISETVEADARTTIGID